MYWSAEKIIIKYYVFVIRKNNYKHIMYWSAEKIIIKYYTVKMILIKERGRRPLLNKNIQRRQSSKTRGKGNPQGNKTSSSSNTSSVHNVPKSAHSVVETSQGNFQKTMKELHSRCPFVQKMLKYV